MYASIESEIPTSRSLSPFAPYMAKTPASKSTSATLHELIHAVDEDTIRSYLTALKLDTSQLTKLNKLRTLAKRKPIDLEKPNLTNNSHNGMTKETKKSV